MFGVAAGCDKLLSLQTVTAGDAHASDALADMSSDAPVCTPNPNVVTDLFTTSGSGSGACVPWAYGYTSGSASLTEAGGQLTVQIGASGGKSYAGCTAMAPVILDEQGVFVEVDQIVTTTQPWTFLALGYSPTEAVEIQAVLNGGTLQMANIDGTITYGMLAYVPSMKFWRIRADLATNAFVGEYSDDAANWHRLGDTVGKVPAASQVTITLQAGDNFGQAGMAVFSHLNACP